MEEMSRSSRANTARTGLLIFISNEIGLQKPYQRIKINSQSYNQMTNKFGDFVVTENDIISFSPTTKCGRSFLYENNNTYQSTNYNLSYSPGEALQRIKSKKLTISQRKLGKEQKCLLRKPKSIIKKDEKILQKQSGSELRSICRSLKCNKKKKTDDKFMKHQSDYNVIKRQLHLDTLKTVDNVFFAFNQKKEIVIIEKDEEEIIQLHQCPLTERNNYVKKEREEICYDFSLNLNIKTNSNSKRKKSSEKHQ